MKSLIEANDYIKALLSKQHYNPDLEYRFLNFCINFTVDEDVILYNNLTKQMLLISKKDFKLLEESNFKLPQDLVESLANDYFLVPNDHNDVIFSDQIRDTVRFLDQIKGVNTYTILPTTGCNARCFYCFEEGTPIFNMSSTVANDVADYIIKKRGAYNKIYIRWFGGEPLCNYKAIDIISKRLKDAGADFEASMTTNGYLFNKDLAKRSAEEWHLKSVQITLDGCAETYNRIKNYVNKPENAFEIVIENIELLLKNDIAVKVRLNLDFYNFEELFDLVSFLAEKFKEYKKLSIYAYPLFESITVNSKERTDSEREELTRKFIELQSHIKFLGRIAHKKIDNTIRLRQCIADSDNAVLIAPRGELGNCEHHVNDDFFGTIYEDSPVKSWREYCGPLDKCYSCAAYPTCVRLKECHGGRLECFDYEQYIRLEDIRETAKRLYKKVIRNNGAFN